MEYDVETRALIERVAALTAENTQLQGTMYAFMKDAPKDRPSRFNVIGNFKLALDYWAWAETQRMWHNWK